MPVNGELFAVLSPAAAAKLPLLQSRTQDFIADDYLAAFPDDRANVIKIQKFYDLAKKLPHTGFGRPEAPRYNFASIKHMLKLLKNGRLHPHNPVKGFFNYNYPVNSLDYVYLNIIGKYLFASRDTSFPRTAKILRLIKSLDIKFTEDIKPHIWQFLNCFNGASIAQFFDHDDLSVIINWSGKFPALSDDVTYKIIAAVQKYRATQPAIRDELLARPLTSHVDKREQQLLTLLTDPDFQFMLIKGDAGVGKTFSVRSLQEKGNFNLFEGDDAIRHWLSDPGDKISILLLDEMNMSKPGTQDFLKGLSRGSVYYQGMEYQLTPNKKILGTCNWESYPDRYYHQFFMDYFETLRFKMPEDAYLVTLVRKILGEELNYFYSEILEAYHSIQKFNPQFSYSTRDLESVAQRLRVLAEDPSDATSLDSKLIRSCVAEFSGTIPTPEVREEYIGHLEEIFSMRHARRNSGLTINYGTNAAFIPHEKEYLVEGIRQDLKIREYALQHHSSYKQGMLIEGNFGLGKSTLYKSLLEHQGFSKTANDPTRRYYEISVGDQTAHAVLEKAFHEGSFVILDELNIDSKKMGAVKSLETLLNQLLTGKDLNGKKATQPGFMVLASQNRSVEQGLKSTSRALRNRMHMMFMEDYSSAALTEIVENRRIEYPQKFVDAFQRCKKTYPETSNRTFYTALNALAPAVPVVTLTDQPVARPGLFARPANDAPAVLPEKSASPKSRY